MIVAKKVSLDAAHFLPGYQGKCANIHGHHWVVELAVEGPVDPKTGMVVDFKLLKDFLEVQVEQVFDHSLLNDQIPNPTAENIALVIRARWNHWAIDNLALKWIKVWETEDSVAILEGN